MPFNLKRSSNGTSGRIKISVNLIIITLSLIVVSLMYYSITQFSSEVVYITGMGNGGGGGGGGGSNSTTPIESKSNQTTGHKGKKIKLIRQIADRAAAAAKNGAVSVLHNNNNNNNNNGEKNNEGAKSDQTNEENKKNAGFVFANPTVGRHETAYYYYYYYDEEGKAFTVKGRKVEAWTRRRTGAFANCTVDDPTSTKPSERKARGNHPESAVAVISCRDVHYRAPMAEIEQGGTPIVIGVLSAAGGKGPIHRDSIRSTWARDRKGVYFLVAGPWEAIEAEYDKHRDMIWIDEDEVYEGENSVLPFKTQNFMYVIHKHSLPGDAGFHYVFKTDDDSYVDTVKLEELLLGHEKMGFEPWDYWGCCTTKQFAPLRDTSLKWHVTKKLYPEEMYPLYCQGAGFAISRKFLNCAVEGDHVQNFRYNPFEDVSMGLLAERCGIIPVSDPDLIRQYRDQDEGTKKVLRSEKLEQIKLPPKATMIDKVVQHRVKTHFDMYAHHLCATTGC